MSSNEDHYLALARRLNLSIYDAGALGDLRLSLWLSEKLPLTDHEKEEYVLTLMKARNEQQSDPAQWLDKICADFPACEFNLSPQVLYINRLIFIQEALNQQ